jgi:Zn-dependent peptidase ImmA (M78 family)
MSREQIPITPSVVTWARARAGYTLDEARADFRQIESWEKGESFPSYPQLEKLADKFKTPIAVFFFPEPPDLEPISNSFRTMPEPQFDQISRRVRFLLRKAKALQINLAELNDGRNPADRLITRDLAFPVNAPIATMAARVREYLGITLEQQMGWESEEKALENWRYRLYDVGVFVFKDAFREVDYSGFCLYDDEFPIIYANNTTAKTRQIFTLFHELAHLLFHTSGIDKFRDDYIDALHGDAKKIEILCNRFAARFLVPAEAFEGAFAGLEASRETAALLAHRFSVSREVIYRMILDRNLISQAEYENAVRAWAGEKKPGTGGDYYNNQIAYLGPRYIGLVFKQYYGDRINEAQLADYLNIAPRNIVPLEEKFLGRGT